MNFKFSHEQSVLRQAITDAYCRDEATALNNILPMAQMSEQEKQKASDYARTLVSKVRENRSKASGVDALMHEFSLSSEEGIALMCLAEALLRIPDSATRNLLIQDKLAGGNWKRHLNNSPSLFVNAAAWGLLITGKLTSANDEKNMGMALTRVLAKGGEPLIRKGVDYAMRLLGKQFVTGQTIEEALANGKEREKRGYLFSFDMLGEAAMTKTDADRYYNDYVQAIHAIGKDASGKGVYHGNGISVKLSAIHPRYSRAQHQRVMDELLPRLKELFMLAKQYDIGLNIDAEEANRLELSLDLLEALVTDPDLKGFKGIGFVVQAYQKRCPYVIDWIIDLARRSSQKLMVRLVKGAYWDSEIKWAQVDGVDGYPVYTRKVHTDVSYLACARKLLDAQDAVFPQFATHNAYTLAAITQLGEGKDFEHQCLHGMGETLYDQVIGVNGNTRHCRIYAPVGTHETLLAYLVRRLLENGANSSFVSQIVDEKVSINDLVRCPLELAQKTHGKMHVALPLPRHLYGDNRLNSKGLNLSNENTLNDLETAMNTSLESEYHAVPLTPNITKPVDPINVKNPADHNDIVGTVAFIHADDVPQAIHSAVLAVAEWRATTASHRANILRQFADLLEENTPRLMMLAVREAGKTLNNAIAEVREAVDFCRYYANECELHAKQEPIGTVVTISPWNFPLAIFIGEVVSALASGNTVLAKPAEQTSLIAYEAVKLLHQAGVPPTVLHFLPGAGDIGAILTQDTRINGVIFTGSTEVAQLINRNLSQRDDNPVLIAETGGMNAMIVDSTALAEQVCVDVLNSAFDSAGQRCSALRILCLQEDIADHMLTMIKGAMDELAVGNPSLLTTDIGPVIDEEAQERLQNHIDNLKQATRRWHQVSLPETTHNGTFIAPILFELVNLDMLKQEVFGPVLHVVRYRASELDDLIKQINSKGYALTHGIHSRIDSTVEHICQKIEAGNIYVNRNIVGAVVGVQPFGGHNASGTGPKAGGPFYLQRLTRSTQWQLPDLTVPAVADVQALDLVENVMKRMGFNHDEQLHLASILGQSHVQTLREAQLELPGPTGESNILCWHAPQKVRIYGGNLVDSCAVLIQLAGSGIGAVVEDNHPLAMWREHLDTLITIQKDSEATHISHWVLLEPMDTEKRTAIANRDGALTHLIDATQGLDIFRLFEEVSISTNTTAAGGNANLMATAEE